MQDHGAKKRGVLLRAKNGDVIGFDETGLRMNLSDSVIRDIAKRLPAGGAEAAVDPAVLGDVDAWNLRQRGDWYIFSANLPGAQGPRQFRRRVQVSDDASAPDIIADTAGAVYGLLSFGGTRRAVTANAPLSFPYHVVTTGDDLGPAGASGTQENDATDVIQKLTEQTRDTLIADGDPASAASRSPRLAVDLCALGNRQLCQHRRLVAGRGVQQLAPDGAEPVCGGAVTGQTRQGSVGRA